MTPQDYAQKLEPLLGKKSKKLYEAWLLAERQERQEIEQYFRFLYYKHFQSQPILFLPPNQTESHGELNLGTVLYNEKPLHSFGLQSKELAQHLAIFGRSGSGKTNTVRVLLKNLLRKKIPFLLFDWKKDYSQLDFAEVFPGMGIAQDDIRVLPIGKRNVKGLRLNPLIPPKHTDAKTWAKQLCEILTHAYLGGPGFESLFLKAIDHCYEERGIYQGNSHYPTFQDVKAHLETMKCTAREAQWLQSVMRTVNSLCFGEMEKVVNANHPDDLSHLMKQNVILEMDTLANADKVFLIETILLWLRHYRLSHPPQNVLESVFIIEEAHHLLRQSLASEESLVETAIREMRSLGIGIVIIDQMPSLISKVALANTYCTIALNVKTGQDVQTLAQAMLISREDKDALGQLPVGQAIVKLQDRFRQPFQIKIPFLDPGKRKILPYQEERADSRIPRNILNIEKNGAKFSEIPISINSAENQLLIDILKYPTDCVTARYQRLGFSARKGNHAKKQLIQKGFIKPVTFPGLHAWLRLFEITEEGKAHLKSLGAFQYSKRYGGLEHLYWREQLEKHFSSLHYKVEKEKSVNGHFVDLLARKNNEKIAIEIETGKSNYSENIKHCLAEKQLTSVIVACTSKAVKEKISSETKHAPRLQIIEARKLLTQ